MNKINEILTRQMEIRYTIKQAAKIALEAQNASNTNGIVHALNECMKAILYENSVSVEKKEINNHPIVILFLDKLCQLAGMQNFSDEATKKFENARNECKKIIEKT